MSSTLDLIIEHFPNPDNTAGRYRLINKGTDYVVRTVHYITADGDRDDKLNRLVEFGAGVAEGWNIARQSLWGGHFDPRVKDVDVLILSQPVSEA